jgi:hypothetical protein
VCQTTAASVGDCNIHMITAVPASECTRTSTSNKRVSSQLQFIHPSLTAWCSSALRSSSADIASSTVGSSAKPRPLSVVRACRCARRKSFACNCGRSEGSGVSVSVCERERRGVWRRPGRGLNCHKNKTKYS